MKKMNIFVGTSMLFLIASSAQAMSPLCEVKLMNRAIYEYAQEKGRSVYNVSVLRETRGPWTDLISENTGGVEFALAIGKKQRAYYFVSGQQIGKTTDCKVLSANKLDPATIDPIKVQAENYKFAVRNVEVYSEAESPWYAYFSDASVSPDFSESTLRKALRADDLPIEISTHAETLNYLQSIIDDEEADLTERYAYRSLKKLLLADFKELRMFKVGVPDQGELKLYIVGRAQDGRLVGLITTVVET